MYVTHTSTTIALVTKQYPLPIHTQTPDALGPVEVKPTNVEVKKEVPFIDLKVCASHSQWRRVGGDLSDIAIAYLSGCIFNPK